MFANNRSSFMSAVAEYIDRYFGPETPRYSKCHESVCMDAPEEFCVEAATLKGAAPGLSDMLNHTDAGFSQTLLSLIDRSGKTDPEIYRKANMDRRLFSKIRNSPDYKPSKSTALSLAIALELDLEQTKDLIGRAGYTLSRSSKFDIILEYCIVNRIYDIYTINDTLYEFDQSLLTG